MSEKTALTSLRLTRGHLKRSLTKVATYSENITDKISVGDLEVRFNKAGELWDEFNETQRKMYDFFEVEGYADPDSDFDEFESKFLVVRSVLQSAIREREKMQKNNDFLGKLAEQQQVFMESLTKSSAPERNTDFFLPKIRIEPFSGNYREWPAFRDMFEGAVHKKSNLTPMQKFHFLKSCLRDEALSLLNHLPVCDATYEQAWARLEKRYDRPRFVINSYIKAFMDLPPALNSNIQLLRNLSNGADEIIRGLTSINSLDRDPWLIYLLLNKLDPKTRQAWSEDSVSEEKPTIDQFLDFLEQRCEALESCRDNTRESSRLKTPGVKSMHASSSSFCPKCNSSHFLSQCSDFLGMDVPSRREFVKVNNICFNCLKGGHSSARCQSKFRCRTCKSRHHSLVHPDASVSNLNQSVNSVATNLPNWSQAREFRPTVQSTSNCPLPSATENVVNNHSINVAHNIPQTLLPTAIGKVLDISGQYQLVRILIDTGSQVSFISESCAQKLGLKRRNGRIPISGIGSTNAGRSRGLISLVVKSRCDSFSIPVDTYILSSVTTNLPTHSFSIEDWDHIRQLHLADLSFNRPDSIDILLGADKAWAILQDGVVHSKQGYPIAHQTIFGWVLAGQLMSNTKANIVSNHAILDIDSILQSFWTIEEISPKSALSDEDLKIEEHFSKTHRRDINGRYIVDLPFKIPPTFADTLTGAVSRLRSMERKFSQNSELFAEYSRFLDEYLALGHMTRVPPSEIGKSNTFYLPHHAVLKPDSATTKLRVVFDGSFKDKNGQSLNDTLMIGPPIQRNLFSVCIRFRRFQFVFTADIVKMFRQIWVSENDSDFQRIVWRKSPSEPFQHFRLRTVTYGTSCAPYLSVRALEQLAADYKNEFPIASEIILNDFYVDDVASGAETLADAIFKKNSLVELLDKCGMKLDKWQSNCRELLDQNDSTFTENLSFDTNADSWVKVLGLNWNSKSDLFSFRLTYTPSDKITKRQILKDVARIFDPLGFLSPSIVQLKIMFQELWHHNLDWDDQVPQTIANQWSLYRNELEFLTKIEIPRTLGLGQPCFELHGFSDASASAYAAVIYSRYQLATGKFETNIVAAKSRVAPLKQLSIPRLELCAALLLARLLVSIQSSLNLNFKTIFAWSDSKVVLSWLSSPPRRWNVFVGNRTAEVLNTIPRNRWFHVASQCNPADCASRGIPPSQLLSHHLWWKGPSWLQQNEDDWPKVEQTEDDPSCSLEEKKIHQLQSNHITIAEHPYETLALRISKWNILLRTVAMIHRFIAKSKKCTQESSLHLTPEEINTAKLNVIRWLQERYFGDYVKFYKKHNRFPQNCSILKLSPILDSDNILRVRGRIENADVQFNAKQPIIIPKGHVLTLLIVRDAHARFLHAGVSTVFALIRQEYWVIGCRNLLRKITHDCVPCFRQRRATITQLMGNLPQQRLLPCRPFVQCGCDYAGPIDLKVKAGRKSTFQKGYIALFVCLVSKAIHLELVSSLTTEAFLAALRRFVSRRGKPSHMYSDNATNFRGCARILSEMHNLVLSQEHNSLVAESLARDGITWHFIPPSAPHFGGLWEAGVKSVKQHLRRVLGTNILTFEEYYTLLTQIEALLNSRPLCPTSDTDLDPLTPSHFFLGESYTAIPEPMIDVPTNRLNTWQSLQAKIHGYWKRWQTEYLTSLQQRPRWQQIETNINVNDLVVIKDPNLPPGKWAMGRIIETHPGPDGLVRVVTLRTASGNLTRPIHKLAVLPVC